MALEAPFAAGEALVPDLRRGLEAARHDEAGHAADHAGRGRTPARSLRASGGRRSMSSSVKATNSPVAASRPRLRALAPPATVLQDPDPVVGEGDGARLVGSHSSAGRCRRRSPRSDRSGIARGAPSDSFRPPSRGGCGSGSPRRRWVRVRGSSRRPRRRRGAPAPGSRRRRAGTGRWSWRRWASISRQARLDLTRQGRGVQPRGGQSARRRLRAVTRAAAPAEARPPEGPGVLGAGKKHRQGRRYRHRPAASGRSPARAGRRRCSPRLWRCRLDGSATPSGSRAPTPAPRSGLPLSAEDRSDRRESRPRGRAGCRAG